MLEINENRTPLVHLHDVTLKLNSSAGVVNILNNINLQIDEGTNVSVVGMWAFANYYGLRVPDIHEWVKASRGMNTWQWAYGAEPNENQANYNNSGDPWDDQITGQNYVNTLTPVGFYNGQNYNGYQTIG